MSSVLLSYILELSFTIIFDVCLFIFCEYKVQEKYFNGIKHTIKAVIPINIA